MALANWHGGKVFLVWVLAAGLCWFLLVVGYGEHSLEWLVHRASKDPVPALIMALIFGVPPLVLTWRWLSAREKR